MEWPNDPDEPISNIGRFCLLENIEEANPTDVAYEEGVKNKFSNLNKEQEG